jgi:lysophospholipase L1-like esterase
MSHFRVTPAAGATRRIAPLGVLVLAASFLVGCDDGVPTGPTLPSDWGDADLTRYVAVGNSLTMGVVDGALVEEGSACSYPVLLAEQAGIEDFRVPRFEHPGIVAFPPNEVGVLDAGRMRLVSLDPPVIERAAPAGPPLNQDLERPYDNLGVSNAILAEALVARDAATAPTGNPLFDVVHRGEGTWAELVEERDATFVTLALGINDVFVWAGAGGVDELAPGLPTPIPTFETIYAALLSDLLRVTEQVVVMNLFDLVGLARAVGLPPVVVDPDTGEPVLDEDGDPIPLIGPEGPLNPGAVLLLPAADLLAQGIGIPESLGGTGEPLPDAVILDAEELEKTDRFLRGYNEVIERLAGEAGVPVVDLFGWSRDVLLDEGVPAGDRRLTPEFLTGGYFGLDGVHPTCQGYGAIANELIATINEAFGADLDPVDLTDLEGIPMPAGLEAELEARSRAGTSLGLPRFEPPSGAGHLVEGAGPP